MEEGRLSLLELRSALDGRRLGADEVVTAALERADRLRALNAFVELRENATADAAAEGPLSGIPIAVKDMFVDRGRIPTCGSNVGARWLTGTATAVERLRAAGASIVGYTNLHEWGLGMTSSVTATGPVANPRDTSRAAGGSSGGTAAAVAAGIVPGGIGTDAGGSIRCPSALCGVVGLKPTWGLVPMQGFAEGDGPIDHIGPIARTVADAGVLLQVLADRRFASVDVGGLRVGVARGALWRDLDPSYERALEAAVAVVAGRVREVVEIDLAHTDTASWAVGYLLLPWTARFLLRALEEEPESFQRETLRLLRIGVEMLREEAPCEHDHVDLIGVMRQFTSTKSQMRFPDLPLPLRKPLRRHLYGLPQGELARKRVIASFDAAFREVDVILSPTVPAPPPRIGGKVELPSGRTSADKAYIRLMGPMNLAGVPALAVPCGETSAGWLPSLMVSAPRGRDDVVLALGEAFERATDGVYANRVVDPAADAVTPRSPVAARDGR